MDRAALGKTRGKFCGTMGWTDGGSHSLVTLWRLHPKQGRRLGEWRHGSMGCVCDSFCWLLALVVRVYGNSWAGSNSVHTLHAQHLRMLHVQHASSTRLCDGRSNSTHCGDRGWDSGWEVFVPAIATRIAFNRI